MNLSAIFLRYLIAYRLRQFVLKFRKKRALGDRTSQMEWVVKIGVFFDKFISLYFEKRYKILP